MNNATVTVVVSEVDKDEYGDSTTTTSERQLSWALVAPRASSERTDPAQPAVITALALYGPFNEAPSFVDTIRIEDHSPACNGDWLVDGFPGPWSLGEWQPGFECALKRADS